MVSRVPDLPAQAGLVIIGGGVIGASMAYHLTGLGCRDVVLLEQGHLSGGTTWHASGLVGQLRATESGTRLVQYSAALYRRLEAEFGPATGYKACGGVTVGRSRDRLTQLRRTAATADAFGLECELISPKRALELYPVLETSDLLGALWLPGDATVNAVDVTASLVHRAHGRGPGYKQETRVSGISGPGGVVGGVSTDRGDIETDTVVNCAGQWPPCHRSAVRGARAPALGRAFLRGDRADRRAVPRHSDPAGPGRLHVLPRRGRRTPRRRLQAGGQALAGP